MTTKRSGSHERAERENEDGRSEIEDTRDARRYRISGLVTPRLGGAKVIVQRKVGRRWRFAKRADSRGGSHRWHWFLEKRHHR